MGEKVALLTDRHFSGATHGMCVDSACPEAADGGPIAPLRDGDRIAIDAQAWRGLCPSAAEPPSFQVKALMLIR